MVSHMPLKAEQPPLGEQEKECTHSLVHSGNSHPFALSFSLSSVSVSLSLTPAVALVSEMFILHLSMCLFSGEWR